MYYYYSHNTCTSYICMYMHDYGENKRDRLVTQAPDSVRKPQYLHLRAVPSSSQMGDVCMYTLPTWTRTTLVKSVLLGYYWVVISVHGRAEQMMTDWLTYLRSVNFSFLYRYSVAWSWMSTGQKTKGEDRESDKQLHHWDEDASGNRNGCFIF